MSLFYFTKFILCCRQILCFTRYTLKFCFHVENNCWFFLIVTLYIENAGGVLTPAGEYWVVSTDLNSLCWIGWSTQGPDGTGPFTFEPGVDLIEGWSIGAFSMKVQNYADCKLLYEYINNHVLWNNFCHAQLWNIKFSGWGTLQVACPLCCWIRRRGSSYSSTNNWLTFSLWLIRLFIN